MYQRLTINLTEGMRRDTLEGRPHLVVSAVILAEDVLDGSGGPIFYPEEENSRAAMAWNHKPAVVYHPDKNGVPVSACDPVILGTRRVGILLNTLADGKKLRTECWLDEERTRSIDSRIITALEKGEKVEVSTGLEFDLDPTEGEFNGKKYKGRALNHRPDHLAILPDKVGALSVKSGGGLLQFNESRQPERNSIILSKGIQASLKNIGGEVKNNELSFSEISYQLADLLASKFGEPGKYWGGWLSEIYSDRVIFYDKGETWMVSYSKKGDTLSLDGDAVEVERVVEYQETGGDTYTGNSQGELILRKKEITTMADKFDRKKHIAGLIGNGFEDTDKVWLEALQDDQLQKIQAKPKETKVENTITVNDEKKVETKQPTFNELLANADPITREAIEEGVQYASAEKTRLIQLLTDNTKNPFKKEFLESKKLPELRGLVTLAGGDKKDSDKDEMFIRPNYFGANAPGPVQGNQDTTEELLVPENMSFNSIFAKK